MARLDALSPFGAARFAIEGAPGTFDRARFRSLCEQASEYNLGPDAVALVMELAGYDPDLEPGDREAIERLLLASAIVTDRGSTRLPVLEDDVIGPLVGPGDAPRIRTLLREKGSLLFGGPEDATPFVIENGSLYSRRHLELERELVARLSQLGRGTGALAPEHPEPHTGAIDPDLSDEQRTAVEACVTSPLSIVLGGPGTGKTRVAGAVLRLLTAHGISPADIALAAPTGKAAHRLGESLRRAGHLPPDGCAPRTLHRLLEYSPTRRAFRRHEEAPLSARICLVDEASMVDLELFVALLRALPPDASLLLFGDPGQLPAVSAGAVLHELQRAEAMTPFRRSLSVPFRASGPEADLILKGIAAIREGGCPTTTPRSEPGDLTFSGLEQLDRTPDESLLSTLCDRVVSRFLEPLQREGLTTRTYESDGRTFTPDATETLERLFSAFRRFQILTPTRRLPTGSNHLNRLVLNRHQRMPGHRSAGEFVIGQPVLFGANDYERGLFNGDTGLILNVRLADGRTAPMAVFPSDEGYSPHPIGPLSGSLRPAFALTIHKAQGSEFDHVLLILPRTDHPLLTRELLYTGLSRARRSVAIVGTCDRLAGGVARGIKRFSGIAERLDAPRGERLVGPAVDSIKWRYE